MVDFLDDIDDAMDLWGIFMFFFMAFVIMSCCGYCCSRKQRGAVLSAPVVVTSTAHTAPGTITVSQLRATATQHLYPTQAYAAPYPPQGAPTNMPMPAGVHSPAGVQPHLAPYPVMPPAASMNPPSYDVAVSGVGAGHSNNTAYEKQAPYNPNFAM